MLDTGVPCHLFCKRVQQILDKMNITLQARYRQTHVTETSNQTPGIKQLDHTWTEAIAATDGGLKHGTATEGAVMFRTEAEIYPTQGQLLCETKCGTETAHKVSTAESGAVERVLQAMPPGSSAQIWMDALLRMRTIQKPPSLNKRNILKV